MRLVLIAVLVAGAAFVLTTRWHQGAAEARPPHLDPDTVALGQTVYLDHCAACHGANLEGEPNWRERDADGYLPAPPHDESGHTWHHPDEILFAITKFGSEAVVGGGYRSRMTGFGDLLTDAEIRATLAYIKSTWPPRVVATHDEINASAR